MVRSLFVRKCLQRSLLQMIKALYLFVLMLEMVEDGSGVSSQLPNGCRRTSTLRGVQILQHSQCLSVSTRPQYTKLPPFPLARCLYLSCFVCIRKPASQAPSAYGAQNAVLSLQCLQLATDFPLPASGRAKLCLPHLPTLTANILSGHVFCRTASEKVTVATCFIILLVIGFHFPLECYHLDHSQLQSQKSHHPAGAPGIILTGRRFQIAGTTW